MCQGPFCFFDIYSYMIYLFHVYLYPSGVSITILTFKSSRYFENEEEILEDIVNYIFFMNSLK